MLQNGVIYLMTHGINLNLIMYMGRSKNLRLNDEYSKRWHMVIGMATRVALHGNCHSVS